MVVGIADGRAGSAHSTMTMVIDPLAVRYVPVPGRPFDPVKPSETCTRSGVLRSVAWLAPTSRTGTRRSAAQRNRSTGHIC